MTYEPEGQGLTPSGNTGVFRIQGLPKAFGGYLQEEWDVCTKPPATSRAYLSVLVKPASTPLALMRE